MLDKSPLHLLCKPEKVFFSKAIIIYSNVVFVVLFEIKPELVFCGQWIQPEGDNNSNLITSVCKNKIEQVCMNSVFAKIIDLQLNPKLYFGLTGIGFNLLLKIYFNKTMKKRKEFNWNAVTVTVQTSGSIPLIYKSILIGCM